MPRRCRGSIRAKGQHGCDVDDRAAATLHHSADGCRSKQRWREDVELQQLVHLGRIGIRKIAKQPRASIVDENVNRWFAAQALEDRFELLAAGQVGSEDFD